MKGRTGLKGAELKFSVDGVAFCFRVMGSSITLQGNDYYIMSLERKSSNPPWQYQANDANDVTEGKRWEMTLYGSLNEQIFKVDGPEKTIHITPPGE
jgi:hypothetical protein